MICKVCKNEFDFSFNICPECGARQISLSDINYDSVELLCETAEEFDADVKISLLASYGIIAFKKYGNVSSVAKIYCGRSNLGVKIYVLKSEFDEAKEILDAPVDEQSFAEEAYDE